jgi:dolichyl-phosphooligosaccharide-protein glycotransferase
MDRSHISKYRNHIIIGVIILLSLITLWMRMIPSFTMGTEDILNFVAMDDPFYNLRQTELMLANFPTYAWYDPMSLYPVGMPVNWGPMMTYITSIMCILAGAATRPEIAYVALATPPVIAAAMIPVMYLVGKAISDWKTGLLAAGLIAIVSGQYFYRSLFGYLDHHIAEVFFSTLFCLGYILTLSYMRRNPVDLKRFETLKMPLLFSGATGVLYLLGLFTMPTMILFAFIVAVFTLVQFIWDSWKRRSSDYLLLLNVVVFGVAVLGLLAYGPKHPGLSLIVYTIGHVYVYLALILATVFLYVLAGYLKNNQKYFYPLSLTGIGIIGVAVLFFAAPEIYNLLISNLIHFFGQSQESLTVQEARNWSLGSAWSAFNYGLILMVGGIAALTYRYIKEEHPESVFVLVWSVVILFSTIQHVRYEYYLAVNIVLLTALCIGMAITFAGDDALRVIRKGLSSSKDAEKESSVPKGKDIPAPGSRASKKYKGEQKSKDPGRKSGSVPKVALFFGILALGLLFALTSGMMNYASASSQPIRMNLEWKESMEWMNANTPDTGVDYRGIYNKETFQYPEESYGVMSWWDYGHLITYIAQRIPNANPFQAGIGSEGYAGASSFFITDSEETASGILDELGTRYIVTDIEMDIWKFWAMATWYNPAIGESPYRVTLLTTNPENPSQYELASFYPEAYYKTMISRLHNFDGSMTNGSVTNYIEYRMVSIGQQSLPYITSTQTLSVEDAHAAAERYNQDAPEGYHAAVLSPYPAVYLPTTSIPALHHYRLVHESPTNVFGTTTPDIRYVKIFEYVPGAHIKGEGIIELDIVSDAGRNFTYRQESVNGEFIVPYSTTGNPYGVKALGKYRIAGTGTEFEVTEEAVLKGLTIQ